MRKYLVYAFGEIFLIVVGILIALQISNWNDRQKSNLQGEELISEIQRGIDSDLKELDKFISSQNQIYKSQLIISNWLASDQAYVDSLSLYFSRAYIANDYSINYSGYETLKKFGLKRIANDSLRASISDLYEIKYPSFIKFTQIYQSFLDELLRMNPEHFNELNYLRSTMSPLNPEKLREDKSYAYHFNSLKNFSQLLMYQGSVLKGEMEKTNRSMSY